MDATKYMLGLEQCRRILEAAFLDACNAKNARVLEVMAAFDAPLTAIAHAIDQACQPAFFMISLSSEQVVPLKAGTTIVETPKRYDCVCPSCMDLSKLDQAVKKGFASTEPIEPRVFTPVAESIAESINALPDDWYAAKCHHCGLTNGEHADGELDIAGSCTRGR